MYAIEVCSVGCDDNGDVTYISDADIYNEVDKCAKCGADKYNMDPKIVAEIMVELYENYKETFGEICDKLGIQSDTKG